MMTGNVAAPWQGGQVSEHAICVLADNPSPMTYEGTNTWIIYQPGEAGAAIVDPGPGGRHLDDIADACGRLGVRPTMIVLTHDHPDHSESAAQLAERLSIPVLSRREGSLQDGALTVPDSSLDAMIVSLPGHSKDMIGIFLPEDRSVLTGDLIFGGGSAVVFWPDGDLGEYLSSLACLKDMVEKFGIERLLPAHGAPLLEPLAIIEHYEAHRHERLEQVRDALRGGAGSDPRAIVAAVYTDIDPRLAPVAERSVRAQLEYLVENDDPCLS